MDNFELYYRLNKDGSSEKVTGVPPLSFVSNGENLSDCKIYGASGGVGDRTANLYNESAAVDTDYYIKNDGSSAIGALGDRFLQVRLDVTPSTYYTFEWSENVFGIEDNTAYIRISEYKQNGIFIKRTLCNCSAQIDNVFTFTTDNNTAYIDLRIDAETSSRGQHLTGVMLTLGNIPPETYEPYGYKIPIVVAGKNLFDKTNLNSILKCYISVSKLSTSADTRSVFIECKPATTYTVSKRQGNRFIVGWTDVLPKNGVELQDKVTDYTATSITTTTGLGAKYLVAYIYNRSQDTLITAEEMIESVQIEEGSSATDYEPHYESQTAAIYLNEPLAEGESISSRSAGVSIPTINGTTILSVDTAVQPSRIDVALTSKQSKMADSMLKYFSYKYGILKRAGLHI